MVYDIAVIGGGPAGMMAAIRASQLKKKVILLEKNDSLGKKLLMTGKTRCNLTNTAPIDDFIKKFGKEGKFFRTAFYAFFNEDLIDFFKAKGLEMKRERQGRVFPVTDKSASVLEVLKEYLEENTVNIMYNAHVADITKIAKIGTDTYFSISYFTDMKNRYLSLINAYKVILAPGGASYKATGSSGDGFRIAGEMGHTVLPLKPVLVPLVARETWVKDLQGLSLENVRLVFEWDKKKIVSEIGEMIFTHFGISGPLVLDLSGQIVEILEKEKEVRLYIDLKPGLREEQIESKLLFKFKTKGNVHLKNLMKDLLPQRLIDLFLRISGLDMDRKTNQVTQAQRRSIVNLLKAFPLTITGSLPIEEAMVTNGGVSQKEIDPRTMESKLVSGLYFSGEVIDGAAPSGGYNLQEAFSTGRLAGESAANA